MIKINKNKFAKTESEFLESLFEKDGTCYGFYKKTRNKIFFKDMQGKVFAALIANKNGSFLVNCSIRNGKFFYQYDLCSLYEKIFGIENFTYLEKKDAIQSLADELLK